MNPMLLIARQRCVRGAIAICAISLCVTGCRVVNVDSLWARFSGEAESPETSRLTDALADALDADAWTENPEWSPVTEPASPLRGLRYAESNPRWLFRPARGTGQSVFSVDHVIRTYAIDRGDGQTGTFDDRQTEVNREAITHLSAIARRDDLAGWNAAILLAQRDAKAARPYVTVLAHLVGAPPTIEGAGDGNLQETSDGGSNSRPISMDMRAAAAEAWCLVLATAQCDGETAMALPGHLLEDMHRSRNARQILKYDLPTIVEGELIRGIGRRVAPARIRDLAGLLNRPPQSGPQPTPGDVRRKELHRAAIDACVLFAIHSRNETDSPLDLHDESVWPRALWNCGDDNDPWVRSEFGLLLAIGQDAGAADVLIKQIADADALVQHRALQNLGVLKNETARETLREYMTRKTLLRKTAVQGLAAFGESELVGFVGDEDARVREELARQLSIFPSAGSATAMARLLTDDVFTVQTAAVEGVRNWPDELVLPLLLQGAVDGNYQTREASLREYAKRTNAAVPPFRPDDDYARRSERAAEVASAEGIAYPLMADAFASMADIRARSGTCRRNSAAVASHRTSRRCRGGRI